VKKELTALKGILFDWDGTVVDSYQPMLLSTRYAYKKHLGILFPKDEEEFRRVSPMRLMESTVLYAGEHAEAVAESYLWYYTNEGYKQGRVFDGMRETLAALRTRGYALGVVTNTSKRRISADLKHHGLLDAIDVIVTSDDTVERKPHPAPLLKGAEKLHLAPDGLAYIGDYPGDIIAAREAGMVSIAALWGGIFPIESVLAESPDYRAQVPGDLLKLFPGVE
jgi:HAD superfamily hydrolase (TIGR01549 family)